MVLTYIVLSLFLLTSPKPSILLAMKHCLINFIIMELEELYIIGTKASKLKELNRLTIIHMSLI